MRSRLLVPLLLALALLALPALALAGPKPIKKPDAPAKTATPPAKKTVTPTHTSTSSSTTSSHATTHTTPTTPINKPSSTGSSSTGSHGAKTQLGAGAVTPKVVSVNVVGRDQSGAEITLPSADTTPAVVAPDPTPLALVSVSDRIRSHSTPTPAWMLALIAVLAAAEAFLVVRLVRNRPSGGGISTAS